MEEIQNNMDFATYEAKIATYSKRLQEMQDAQEYQTQMLNGCMQKRDTYKKLCYESLNISGKNIQNIVDPLSELMDGVDEDNTPIASNSSVISGDAAGKDQRIVELEDKIKELTSQIKSIKEDHAEYRKRLTIL